MLEGAEALLEPYKFLDFSALKKVRIAKKYRPELLDEKLRFERTRREARILGKIKSAGVLCPAVFAVGRDYIVIEKLSAKTLNRISRLPKKTYFEAGKLLAKLHSIDVVHGDYTPANLMLVGDKLYVIDFGLGFVSAQDEDKAVDLLTFVDSVGEREGLQFVRGYFKLGEKKIIDRMKKIQTRGRYKKKE